MKVFIIFLSLLGLLTSCSSHSGINDKKTGKVGSVHEQNLILHISKPEDQSYKVYKKIEDNETVQTLMNVLQNVSWENAKISMSRGPDYKIKTINIDRTISYEPITYAVWITPMKDLLEIIIEGQSKYGKLSKQESTILLMTLRSNDE
ncbi:hypothetical protein [Cohnella lupini]|uniref:YhfM-like domain-containing protein n=1 Tax=Cohnella lupini TaxID=1294267 RepID=A0A3D9IDW9_9BACL|nr:hypothetical protein [Cohnella lupini]RED59396.1 hypothetical protein DFP95_107235 [Cohnella lupini]